MSPKKSTAIQGKYLVLRLCIRQTKAVGVSQFPTSMPRSLRSNYFADVYSTSIHNAPLPDAASPTRFKAPLLLIA